VCAFQEPVAGQDCLKARARNKKGRIVANADTQASGGMAQRTDSPEFLDNLAFTQRRPVSPGRVAAFWLKRHDFESLSRLERSRAQPSWER